MNKKTRVISNFSKQAHQYETAATIQKITAERLARKIMHRANLSGAGNILEIGCGTGLLSEHLINLFPNQEIYFVDPAAEMLHLCKQRLNGKKTFIQNTIENYLADKNYSAIKYSVIASSFTMHWISNLADIINQLLDKLEINGQLFISIPVLGSFPEWQTICKQLNIPFTGNTLPDLTQLKSSMRPGVNFESEEYIYSLYFSDALKFFQEMKRLGANTSIQEKNLKASEFRLLIHTWNNQPLNAAIKSNDIKAKNISCTYRIAESIICRNGNKI